MDRQEAKQRAQELVDRMTVEEVCSQLRYNAPAIDRLGIPAYNWWGEALHGVARAGCATSFPQAIGMAAAFDPELMGEIGEVISTEGRAKYNAYSEYGDRDIYKGLTFWSPNVNIFRDPRWGRGQETYGEDPYLTGTLGEAFVKGLQGDGEYLKAAACAKHYAVHSGPEALRHSFNAKTSMKDLFETYLPAFERLVTKANVESVMGAYNRTNDEPCNASRLLMQDILRGRWKFEGHYLSDCWAIRDFHENHHVTNTPEESAAMAVNAGCDLNCGDTFVYLCSAWKMGLIKEERLREAAVRLFTTRYLLGLFDETEYDEIPYTVVECGEHLKLSEKAALESIVLLKNDGILPMDPQKLHTVGVIGPNANSRGALVGNYHGTATEYITPLDGILQYLKGTGVRVLYSEGCDIKDDRIEKLAFENDRISEAVIVADQSDAVILVVGLNENLEGEEGDTGNSYASGDKVDLLLPASQRALADAVLETGTPVIVCLIAGSAIDLSFAQENKNASAVLNLWYPGARGGEALAKILFGEISPSGKLPLTFYHDTDSLPEFTDYSMQGRTYRYFGGSPLYPFGYGLTYADVKVENVVLSSDGTEVLADCRNDADTDTDDVLQVYVDPLSSKDRTPNPRLCGIKRFHVKAGETVRVLIPLDEYTFTVINDAGERVSGGNEFILYVGTGQPDEVTYSLTGKRPLKIPVRRDETI